MKRSWQCPPRSILAAVDFGEESARALAIGGLIAEAFGSRLRALHAERFEPPPYFTVEQIVRLEAERRLGQASAARHLSEFAANATTYPAEAVAVEGRPLDAILEATADADMVIVGTHGRRGPGRWWLGSVAERIVRAAEIPVLVTRTDHGSPKNVFERIGLLQDGDAGASAAASRCARELSGIGGGSVVELGSVQHCDASGLEQATLVVAALSAHRNSWGLTDDVARAFAACRRPVLFIPAESSTREEPSRGEPS